MRKKPRFSPGQLVRDTAKHPWIERDRGAMLILSYDDFLPEEPDGMCTDVPIYMVLCGDRIREKMAMLLEEDCEVVS